VTSISCWKTSAVSVGHGVKTDEAATSRATLIRNLIDEQYEHPVRIVAFNTMEGWSRDVTVDVADELRRRYAEFSEVPDTILEFMDAHRR
jgi:hypothetical protein